MGLINDVVDRAEDLEAAVQKLVEELSHLSPHSLRVQKAMLHLPFKQQKSPLIRRELELFKSLWMHPWHRRFLDSFTRKN